jgi:hypothetical protein
MSAFAGKKTLTRDEYLTLLGLAQLLRAAVKRMDETEAAMFRILGVEDYDSGGWIIADEKWSGLDIDAILRQHDISIETEVAV